MFTTLTWKLAFIKTTRKQHTSVNVFIVLPRYLLLNFVSTDFLDYWLNSVHTHVHHQLKEVFSQNRSDEARLLPPVIIVCTKKDMVVSLNFLCIFTRINTESVGKKKVKRSINFNCFIYINKTYQHFLVTIFSLFLFFCNRKMWTDFWI